MTKNNAPALVVTLPAAKSVHTQASVYAMVRNLGLTMRTIRVNGQAQGYAIAQMRSKDTLHKATTYQGVADYCTAYRAAQERVAAERAKPVAAKAPKAPKAPKAHQAPKAATPVPAPVAAEPEQAAA